MIALPDSSLYLKVPLENSLMQVVCHAVEESKVQLHAHVRDLWTVVCGYCSVSPNRRRGGSSAFLFAHYLRAHTYGLCAIFVDL